ncbi:MAG: ABC transporter ATP-binding protein, partial [Clostridiales bacterium]|nr:ABC transporter ATP-binding protein [Clostridiales bacterium]
LGLTYLFIAHDLSVVKYLSDRIAVMYLGELVELSGKREIFDNPLHPYTVALMSAIPKPNPRLERKRIILAGDVPNPADPPQGCKFHTRCNRKMPVCEREHPELLDMGGHAVRCHLYREQGGGQ